MNFEHEWDERSVQFPLTKASIVLDIGGYKGRWTKEIASRYSSRIFMFEPQHWAVEIAKEELKDYPNVMIFDFGLGVEPGIFQMEEFETDGASFVMGRSQRQQSGEGNLVAIETWLHENKIAKIDLVMMNIEGYEFQLIPHMIKTGIMKHVQYFMCQFHPNGPADANAYEAIRKQMGEVMDIHFDYGIVLVCWKAKSKPKAPSKSRKK